MDSPPDGNAGEMSPPSKRPRLETDEQEPRQRIAEREPRAVDMEARAGGEDDEDEAEEESASRDIDSRPNSIDSPVVGPERPPNGRGEPGAKAKEALENLYRKESLPPPMDHEIEFLIKDPKSFAVGQSVTSESKTLHGCFTFRLLVFPMGTEGSSPPSQVAAFVEALPPPDCDDVRWAFESVKYQIAVVNWKDYRKSTTQTDTWTFNKENADRGWHKTFLKAKDMSPETGWLSEKGELCLRASCSSKRAMCLSPGRRQANYVGLKNHGATCYMNCLLQTLFCLGHFRHVAYSIEVPENDQAVVSSDDIPESLGFDDDRPALPLLVSLQNLFYRLQTSSATGPQGAVSCRELMRSFGWDTADAFMQHDAQELNRLLCDRLEEQMKGTPTDGEIKRLFEGEFENYIECLDVEYKSQRNETFYDLQLNVRDEAGNDITSLEDSLKDFIREEVLEGDNAYDAEGHGKQRARKGIRFKRFPPVLYIQLKRFMFDPDKMDMTKLNCKMEFPQVLDLEAFAAGSGKYMLHTVIVHSGGVSSGHYYAFVRVRDGEKSQWVKFDDECVVFCSQEAAIDDNYGGEDCNVWNYFPCTPSDIRQRSKLPGAPRIHNAYMLSYVRVDSEKELLTPPVLKGSNYRALIERCSREEKLAEERKRARYEQMMRVEVKAVLEQDLMKMKGFWPSSVEEIPVGDSLKVSRDDHVEDVLSALMEQGVLARSSVDQGHAALFLLLQRPKSRTLRFRHLPKEQSLKVALHDLQVSVADSQQLVLLVQVSIGYDPISLEMTATNDDEMPHELSGWTEELILLVVKYYCPVKEVLITLGCWYGEKSEPLKAMMEPMSGWFDSRLDYFVRKGEVAEPRDDAEWLCFEEMSPIPKDLKQLNLERAMDIEGLYCGDIVIWQPVCERVIDMSLEGPETEESPGQCLTVQDFAQKCLNRLRVVVRLMSPEAPWCPEGVPSDLLVGMEPPVPYLLHPEDAPPESLLEKKLPGQIAVKEFTVDMQWRVDKFRSIATKALGQPEGDGARMWIWNTGAPNVVPTPPRWTEDVKNLSVASALLNFGHGYGRAAPQRLLLDAVILPAPPPKMRPILVRFYNQHVQEVGAHIFHVPELEEEDDRRLGRRTGVPTINPDAVLRMAREYLESPAADKFRRKFCWVFEEQKEEPDVKPLRLLEVAGNRITKVFRERNRPDGPGVDDDDPETWHARQDEHNFIYHAFRVEPDLEKPGKAPSQLIEVFHTDPSNIIGCFGHPFLLEVSEGQTRTAICIQIEDKLHWSRRIYAAFFGDTARCRLLMGKGASGANDRVRLYQEVRLEYEWQWQVPREAQLFGEASRPTTNVPDDWHPDNSVLGIERIHPLHQGRSNAPNVASMPQRSGNKPLTIKAA